VTDLTQSEPCCLPVLQPFAHLYVLPVKCRNRRAKLPGGHGGLPLQDWPAPVEVHTAMVASPWRMFLCSDQLDAVFVQTFYIPAKLYTSRSCAGFGRGRLLGPPSAALQSFTNNPQLLLLKMRLLAATCGPALSAASAAEMPVRLYACLSPK